MPEMTARERIQLLMHQEQVGRALKAEIVLQDVTISAVAEAMGLPRTSLSLYLGGQRPWAQGLGDFQAAVRKGIEAAVEQRAA